MDLGERVVQIEPIRNANRTWYRLIRFANRRVLLLALLWVK